VGAADLKNKIVKTDTVEKPDEPFVAMETKKERNENDNSCVNVLFPNILIDTASSDQDIILALASEKVDGTNLAPDELHDGENSDKINSTDVFQQNLKSEVILEECFKGKPENNGGKLQSQTNCNSKEVSRASVSTKELDSALSGMGEKGVSSNNFQGDYLETPNKHSEPVYTTNETIEYKNKSLNVMALSVSDNRFTNREVEDTNLSPESIQHSFENANKEMNDVAQENLENQKTEVNKHWDQTTNHRSSSDGTNYITEVSTIRQSTEQNTEILPHVSQDCDEINLYDKCDAIFKPNVSITDIVNTPLGNVSTESQNRMTDIQSSPSVHLKSNFLVEDEKYNAIKLSSERSQHSSLNSAAFEMNLDLKHVLIKDTDRINKDHMVKTNETCKDHTDKEHQGIKSEQLNEPGCGKNASHVEEQSTSDELNKMKCDQSIDILGALEDGQSGNLTATINRNGELNENEQVLEKEVEKIQANFQQEDLKDTKKEKHLDEKLPETSMKMCLSDSGLISEGFAKGVQNFDRDLTEATQPSMNQELEQVTCCERDETKDLRVFHKLDSTRHTELQPQECIEAAESVENRGSERYDDVTLKLTKVGCPHYEEHANGNLVGRVE
ncbi:MAG: hypothetical protein ACRC4N_00120, partial [Gammaproteobacteria bacterium]